VLPTGRLLLFDNMGSARGVPGWRPFHPGNPVELWRPAGEKLFTEVSGSVQRLANGNTLIVESNFGRAVR
jgi:hypothetical protein